VAERRRLFDVEELLRLGIGNVQLTSGDGECGVRLPGLDMLVGHLSVHGPLFCRELHSFDP
jgi:hypothetical protein